MNIDYNTNKILSIVDTMISMKDLTDIIFTCNICKFTNESIIEINNHIKEHTKEHVKEHTKRSEINDLVFKNKFLNKKIKLLEKTLSDNEKDLRDISSSFRICNMKISILTNIIENHTNIEIDNIIKEESNKCHIYDTGQKGIVPIYLHTIAENTSKDIIHNITDKELEINKFKTTSRNVKKYKKIDGLELKEELNDDDIKNKVDNIDKESRLIAETKFNPVNKIECRDTISNIFKNISESRNYTKYIIQLRQIRINMLKWISMRDYEIMLNDHVNTLKNIFMVKSYDKLKIKKLIYESLSNLEKRMIKFGNYFNTQIDSEEIEKVKISLENCIDNPKEYEIFKISFKKMHNYSLALFSIKKCLKSFLINKYGFNNLVYIKLNNTCEKDPHSFYYISGISKEERYWTLDSRLEDLSIELSNSLYPYCLELYRKIYYDSFSNHCYKYNYEYVIPNIYNELDQLAENMIILHNLESCRNILIDLLKEFAILEPTEKDKINIKSQDSTQKAKFKEYKKSYDRNDIVRSLFTDYNEKVYKDFFDRFNT
jgi:hypothetical protein